MSTCYICHFITANGLNIEPPSDMPTVTEQMNDTDDILFYSVLQNQNHAEHCFLVDNLSIICDQKSTIKLLHLRLQNLIIVIFFIANAIS